MRRPRFVDKQLEVYAFCVYYYLYNEKHMEQKNFIDQLKDALMQSHVWQRQHPMDHLTQYDIINILLDSEIIMQILSLQRNDNYGFVIHSYINPKHPVWLSPIGLMFGQGEMFEDNGDKTLICPPDPEYIANILEKLLRAVYGSTNIIHVECE